MTIDTQLHLEGVRAERREAAAELAGLISSLAGGGLQGLTAFGSCVSAGFGGAGGRLMSVAVMERINLDQLAELAEHGPRLARLDVAAPLVMTPESIERSRDTFALELVELGQFRATIFGRDYFDRLQIDAEHLRLQIERSFKQMLIDLRQGLLYSVGREGILSGVVESIGERLLRTMRGLLWLRGQKEALSSTQVIAAVQKLAGREFNGIHEAVTEKMVHEWDEFKQLYGDLERLASLSDEMG